MVDKIGHQRKCFIDRDQICCRLIGFAYLKVLTPIESEGVTVNRLIHIIFRQPLTGTLFA